MRVFGGNAVPPPTSTAARPIGVADKPHSNPTSLTSSQALAALIPAPTPNFARNSPTTISNFEFRSLELQRFQPLLKLLPIELHASFRRQAGPTTHRHRSQAHHTAACSHKREKILPARSKHPKIGVFSSAGGILSRSDLCITPPDHYAHSPNLAWRAP